MHWFRSIKMTVTICYFLKSIKSVFILIQCNISLSNNCRPSLCDRLNLRKNQKKNSLAVCAYEISPS